MNEPLFEEVFDVDEEKIYSSAISGKFETLECVWETSPLVDTISTSNTTESHKPIEKKSPLRVCSNSKKDLSENNILTTVARLKGKLLLKSLEYNKAKMRIKCVMSSFTKDNLVKASKRLRMYGKNLPVVPSFDRFWNELPEMITINGGEGIELVIEDPNKVGKFYLKLIATPLNKEGKLINENQ